MSWLRNIFLWTYFGFWMFVGIATQMCVEVWSAACRAFRRSHVD